MNHETRVSPNTPDESGAPPLPELLPQSAGLPSGDLLPHGCYLMSLTDHRPDGSGPKVYEGTLRIERHDNGLTVSGDLYERINPDRAPGIADRIPIFPIGNYRCYLRVTQAAEQSSPVHGIEFGMESFIFRMPNVWEAGDMFRVLMTRSADLEMDPPGGISFVGEVVDGTGVTTRRIKITRVSDCLRRARIQIDSASGSMIPADNGSDMNYQRIFKEIGWDVSVYTGNNDIAEPENGGGEWDIPDLHIAILKYRGVHDLDAEWLYYLLAVKMIKGEGHERGLMFTPGGPGSVMATGQAAAIASHWRIPEGEHRWGDVQGKIWGDVSGMLYGEAKAPYFRTAMHEIGHAMGLEHRHGDNDLMETTVNIAYRRPPVFPRNIHWSFAPEDKKQLCHRPDILVRPGGIPWNDSRSSAAAVEADEFELHVGVPGKEVPIGAPVRVDVDLKNVGDRPMHAPISLSMKNDNLRGTVTGPDGTVRFFRTLVHALGDDQVSALDPGRSVCSSITLLHGNTGAALFPEPGDYRISVEARWDHGGRTFLVSGTATTTVTRYVDEAHREAAEKILNQPAALLALVIGGDHITFGIKAIRAALKNKVLRPHFSYIEAWRIAKQSGRKDRSLEEIRKIIDGLIDDATVMSTEEVKKLARWSKIHGVEAGAGGYAEEILKRGTDLDEVGNEIAEVVDVP